MSLKTDYKDALFDGMRRYMLVRNEDGTVSMLDVTKYTQEGDKFGENDINAINTVVNQLQDVEVPALKNPIYEQAASRESLSSGEELNTAFGKIRKWFADLKAVAFSGNYNDLSNKPASLPANGGNADMVDNLHATDLFIRNKLNSSAQGITLDDKSNSWIPFKSYRTTPDGKFSAGLAVSYEGGGAIEVRDETDGTAGTIKSRLELRQNGDIVASTGRIIADGGNAETSRRLNSTIPGSAFSNPQLKGDLKGFNYTYEETLSGTAEHEKSPQPNAQTRSWNIINLAHATNRAAQIAIQTFRPEQKMYFRGRHIDNDDFSTWQEWKEVFTSDKIANNLATTAAGYALDARQGKEISTRLEFLELALSRLYRYSENYSIYYPQKDYTLDAVGTSQSYFGFLNLGNNQYAEESLFEITDTDASSSSCTNTRIDSPTNYITIKSEGLYQIDVRITIKGTAGSKVWLYKKDGSGFPIAEFGCLGSSKTGNVNIISYMSEGSRIFVAMKLAAATGSISISSKVGDGVISGIFIKKIM